MLINANDAEHDIVDKAANVTPSPRQLRWQELELTAFFHFGMNTFTGQGMGRQAKKTPNYLILLRLMPANGFGFVKEAGFKQVIITAKHHDGFCLWPSKYTAHSVKSSPWKNGEGDVVKEVANACREYKSRFPAFTCRHGIETPRFMVPAMPTMIISVNQLTELLTQYGRAMVAHGLMAQMGKYLMVKNRNMILTGGIK